MLAAPIAAATGERLSASARAASLWGTVTFTPRKPERGSARMVSANSSGATGTFRYSQSRPSSASAAACMTGERLWATGNPATPSRGGRHQQRVGDLPPRRARSRL